MLERIQGFLARRQQRKVLLAHVAALSEERFEGYRCVVQAGLSRVFVGRDAEGRTEIRVPADVGFDPRMPEAQLRLSGAGFTLEAETSGLEWKRSERRVVGDVEGVLFDALGIESGILYSVAVEPDRGPDNPELRTAMRTLAERHTPDARHAVYRALLDATLLLAVARGDGGVRALPDAEDLGGRPTWLAFSGRRALEEHDTATEAVSLSGLRLVGSALHHRIGALRLDFGSRVGGELYANELRSIAESIPAVRPPGFETEAPAGVETAGGPAPSGPRG